MQVSHWEWNISNINLKKEAQKMQTLVIRSFVICIYHRKPKGLSNKGYYWLVRGTWNDIKIVHKVLGKNKLEDKRPLMRPSSASTDTVLSPSYPSGFYTYSRVQH